MEPWVILLTCREEGNILVVRKIGIRSLEFFHQLPPHSTVPHPLALANCYAMEMKGKR